jgi:hypothetical protein
MTRRTVNQSGGDQQSHVSGLKTAQEVVCHHV